jgi:predicted small lipoprotein YifL
LARAARWAGGAVVNSRLIGLICVVASLYLAGCGQTGPLYLPDDDAKVVIKPAAESSPE